MLDKRICIDCQIEKPITEYMFRGPKKGRKRGYYLTRCKKCHYAKRKDLKYKDFDRIRWLELLVIQNGMCAICSEKFFDPSSVHVDHCHQTENVRGLLCGHCNLGLGLFKDKISNFQNAILYLEKATNANG